MANFTKSFQKNNPPNSFDIQVTNPDGVVAEKRNCTLYNGLVVLLKSVGRGKKTEKAYWSPEGDADVDEEWEYYAYIPQPLYFMHGCSEALKAEIRALDQACAKKQEYTECFNKYSEYMCRMGEYRSYITRNMDDVQAEKVKANRKITLYEGFGGFKILERLPSEIWSKIKPHAKFYKKEEIEDYYEDCDDFGKVENARDEAGWNYSSEVVSILIGLGYEIEYWGKPVEKYEDIAIIEKPKTRR